jgi:hypothetical protein
MLAGSELSAARSPSSQPPVPRTGPRPAPLALRRALPRRPGHLVVAAAFSWYGRAAQSGIRNSRGSPGTLHHI